MARLWLVLLLALSLWPSAAAASSSAPLGETDEMHAADIDYGRHALRSSSRLGVVLGLVEHGPGCGGGCSHRSGHGGSAPVHLLSGSEFLLAGVRLLVGPCAETPDDVCAPLCERLPYDATAPPSLR